MMMWGVLRSLFTSQNPSGLRLSSVRLKASHAVASGDLSSATGAVLVFDGKGCGMEHNQGILRDAKQLVGAWKNRPTAGQCSSLMTDSSFSTAAPSVTVCHIRVDIFEGSSLFHPLPSGSGVAIVNSWRVWITGKDKVGKSNNTQRGLGKDLTPLGEKPVWDWPAGPSVSVLPYLLCHGHTGPGAQNSSQDVGLFFCAYRQEQLRLCISAAFH